MSIIPSGLKTIYNQYINDLIDSEFGINCSVNQPATKSECPNCILNTQSNVSSNRYKTGGPISFTTGQICPYCNGVGYSETPQVDTVRMIVYWDANQWAKENKIRVVFPTGTIVTKGKIADFSKILNCANMTLHQGLAGIDGYRYEKQGEPSPFGIGKDSFFVCVWSRPNANYSKNIKR